jgi:hypothetical protein
LGQCLTVQCVKEGIDSAFQIIHKTLLLRLEARVSTPFL